MSEDGVSWQGDALNIAEKRSGFKSGRPETGFAAMFIGSRISTSYGKALAAEPLPIIIPSDPARALEFASRIDREADAELKAGHVLQAERLAHLALEARCRATGQRA